MLRKYIRSNLYPKLTVLTEPVYKDITTEILPNGPYAVARSLLEGLKKTNVYYNYNPQSLSEVEKVVVVLSGFEALSKAIDWKCRGKIKKLLVGPNVAAMPTWITCLPNSNQINICLQPCQWTIDWWKSIDPEFSIPLRIWSAGVNTEFWQPPENKPIYRNVLIYKKSCPEDLFQSCISSAKNKNLTVSTVEYGNYSHDEYKTKLAQSDFAVFLSESESQGIALLECWSCNVPTLVWNRGYFEWQGYSDKASSAPYLSDLTGIFFSGTKEIETSLQYMLDNLKNFQPRSWVLSNGSDEVSALNLLKIINRLKSSK
jgi:hypothetical protein